MLVHLNIGTNQGDRHALLERAVALIVSELQPRRIRRSDIVESEPWGFTSANSFLNLGLDIDIAPIEPEALLDSLQAIERRISATPHRNPDGSYRDRHIDIDIILIDDLRLDTPRLTVPHPRMRGRAFVTGPLRQLRGADFIIP